MSFSSRCRRQVFSPRRRLASGRARTEEDVLYTAAILFGDIIRARMGRK